MPILVAFMVVGLAFLLLLRYEQKRNLKYRRSESDLQAMDDGATFGGLVGQAHMNQMGIAAEPIKQREEVEFKKFKFED
jgi:preprotein translocase subunit YajC